MPGFDGTGPMGMGPMTGGGRGFCAVPLHPAWPAYASARFPMTYAAPKDMPYYRARSFGTEISREEELSYLKRLSQSMKLDLEELEERIQKLESDKD